MLIRLLFLRSDPHSVVHMSLLSGVLRRGEHDSMVLTPVVFSSPREVQDTLIICSFFFLAGGRVRNHRFIWNDFREFGDTVAERIVCVPICLNGGKKQSRIISGTLGF
jgi:hypothetical protein